MAAPKHLAIIPDGNRRWAKQNGGSLISGHQKGADNLVNVVSAMPDYGIETVTLYVFSTENWRRSPLEVRAFMLLFNRYLKKTLPEMCAKEVGFHTIGATDQLPRSVQKTLQHAKEETKAFTRFNLILALNYGSKDEITRACRTIAKKAVSGEIEPNQINEQLIGSHLDTAPWPDPDLLIRTSGEMRISNFLLWQLAYTEIYFSDLLWPDFDRNELDKALEAYTMRERRQGR